MFERIKQFFRNLSGNAAPTPRKTTTEISDTTLESLVFDKTPDPHMVPLREALLKAESNRPKSPTKKTATTKQMASRSGGKSAPPRRNPPAPEARRSSYDDHTTRDNGIGIPDILLYNALNSSSSYNSGPSSSDNCGSSHSSSSYDSGSSSSSYDSGSSSSDSGSCGGGGD